jgi:glycosyltransferase involved in cell wall biosynthesis
LRLRSEPDNGLYDAMNKGIEMSSGKYVIFLGAGDRLRDNVLEQIRNEMPETGLNFVYGDVFLVKEGKRYGWEFHERDLIKEKNICHQAIFYERRIFDLLGRYETKYKTHADFAFNIKCFGALSVTRKYINRVITDYEGGGLSEGEPDLAFKRDLNWLVFSRLGIKAWLKYVFAPRVAASFQYRIVRPLSSRRSN